MDWYDGLEIAKDPDSVLDYQMNFSDWLVTGDSIATRDVDPGGLTLGNNSNDDTTVTFWVSGGTAGSSYTVRVRVNTAQGRTIDRSVVFVVNEK